MADLTDMMIGSAFVLGLMGGMHCAGMCGGIVGAISRPWSSARDTWRFHFAYNGGRILSYGLAGFLVGALGSAGFLFRDFAWLQQLFAFAASLLLLALGFSVAGAVPVVRRIEGWGAALWRHIQPLSRGLFPVDSALRAFAVGLLWGWLPCGLVYTVLLTALATADPMIGALVMLAFGFGTLPNLIGMGAVFSRSRNVLRSRWVRIATGAVVSSFGAYGFARALAAVLDPHGSFCHFIPF